MRGSSKNVLTYEEGTRRQPQGLRPEQLMVTTLGPHRKILYGMKCYEHEGLRRAEELAVAKQTGQADARVSSTFSGVPRAARVSSTSDIWQLVFLPSDLEPALWQRP